MQALQRYSESTAYTIAISNAIMDINNALGSPSEPDVDVGTGAAAEGEMVSSNLDPVTAESPAPDRYKTIISQLLGNDFDLSYDDLLAAALAVDGSDACTSTVTVDS